MDRATAIGTSSGSACHYRNKTDINDRALAMLDSQAGMVIGHYARGGP